MVLQLAPVILLPKVSQIYGRQWYYYRLADTTIAHRCGNSSRNRQKLVKGIEGLPGVRQELAKGDRELAGNASGVHQKMIETRREFTRSYWEDRREILGGSTI
ncbi:hypothetical protein GW17_00057414, partial [Ensete ventricosum]